ncbi:Major royal jelly protein 3 [Trachymyrmex cornetzi]|uniref:Major royal jelly protein 3 n=1 Tax=Trachymyrmex cornetzi TaxID=471704 RepID=A0A151J2W0_9HYME|nr:Major royal jelly protein 3 [Trachymyrmex cornetzi]
MEYSLFTLLILSMAIMNLGYEVDVVHEWEYVEFEWESQEQKENAINSGTYNPNTSILVDATKTDDGRLFITATNVFGPGSPATLTTITNKTGSGGPILRPYPNWSWHNGSCICDGIVNVFRIDIQCNHIIVLDYGKMGLSQICNPKLLIFDLKDDTLVKTIHLPLDFATNQTGSGLLITPLVYIRNISGKCTQFLNKMFPSSVRFPLSLRERKRRLTVEHAGYSDNAELKIASNQNFPKQRPSNVITCNNNS